MTEAVAVKERPILFSGSMVRAILEDRKTKTRRVMKPQPPDIPGDVIRNAWSNPPYGDVGDRLWVREMLRRPDGDPWLYDADRQPIMVRKSDETAMLTWAHHKDQDYCPSIHVPRWASRITLEITGVRVERLREISEEDAIAEGIQVLPLQSADDPSAWWQSSPGVHQDRTARGSFIQLWDSINGKRPNCAWSDNPWIWVIEFRRII